MPSVYHGIRGVNGVTVTRDGEPFDHRPSCRYFNHSPTGFEWGYGGSGPAQLALAILLDFCNSTEAIDRHQDFKWWCVACLPHEEWTLGGREVEQWLQIQRDKVDVAAFLSTPEERP